MYGEIQKIGVEAIVKYLEYIGIKNINYEASTYNSPIYQLGRMSPTSYTSHGTYVTFKCECDVQTSEYIRPWLNKIDVHQMPLFDSDSIYGECLHISSFTVFKYEQIAHVEFLVDISSPQSINQFMFDFKNATEKLRYKRFNDDMDKQILEELSTSVD